MWHRNGKHVSILHCLFSICLSACASICGFQPLSEKPKAQSTSCLLLRLVGPSGDQKWPKKEEISGVNTLWLNWDVEFNFFVLNSVLVMFCWCCHCQNQNLPLARHYQWQNLNFSMTSPLIWVALFHGFLREVSVLPVVLSAVLDQTPAQLLGNLQPPGLAVACLNPAALQSRKVRWDT